MDSPRSRHTLGNGHGLTDAPQSPRAAAAAAAGHANRTRDLLAHLDADPNADRRESLNFFDSMVESSAENIDAYTFDGLDHADPMDEFLPTATAAPARSPVAPPAEAAASPVRSSSKRSKRKPKSAMDVDPDKTVSPFFFDNLTSSEDDSDDDTGRAFVRRRGEDRRGSASSGSDSFDPDQTIIPGDRRISSISSTTSRRPESPEFHAPQQRMSHRTAPAAASGSYDPRASAARASDSLHSTPQTSRTSGAPASASKPNPPSLEDIRKRLARIKNAPPLPISSSPSSSSTASPFRSMSTSSPLVNATSFSSSAAHTAPPQPAFPTRSATYGATSAHSSVAPSPRTGGFLPNVLLDPEPVEPLAPPPARSTHAAPSAGAADDMAVDPAPAPAPAQPQPESRRSRVPPVDFASLDSVVHAPRVPLESPASSRISEPMDVVAAAAPPLPAPQSLASARSSRPSTLMAPSASAIRMTASMPNPPNVQSPAPVRATHPGVTLAPRPPSSTSSSPLSGQGSSPTISVVSRRSTTTTGAARPTSGGAVRGAETSQHHHHSFHNQLPNATAMTGLRRQPSMPLGAGVTSSRPFSYSGAPASTTGGAAGTGMPAPSAVPAASSGLHRAASMTSLRSSRPSSSGLPAPASGLRGPSTSMTGSGLLPPATGLRRPASGATSGLPAPSAIPPPTRLLTGSGLMRPPTAGTGIRPPGSLGSGLRAPGAVQQQQQPPQSPHPRRYA
ncbi:hypothetical protein H9P43_002554 [Blastocladiella emersonii ATCC 22665]|nr:hypothetical protein H9P43_002554 [Blastocladiella emersonii ATCC 22665]